MAIKPFAMCHHTGFVYMYFTVTSQDEVEALCGPKHIFVILGLHTN